MLAITNVVDAVLWALAALSLLTWTILFYKLFEIWRNARHDDAFLAHFTQTRHVGDLAGTGAASVGTMADLCKAGLAEIESFTRGTSVPLDSKDRREMLRHALRQRMHVQQSKLENGLAVLASIGSTAPFIGLFGTVWGIMNALRDISQSGSAGLDVVAGPIGEALIATAMGIAAAIPAVLAYNYFLRRVRLAVTAMEQFGDSFIHLVIKSGLDSGGRV